MSTATEVAFTAPKSGAATVSLTDSSGGTVPGSLRADGSAWVPDKQLRYATSYTATVTAGGATKKVSFTTMDKPGNLVEVSTPLGDGATYGVAMPLVFTFARAVPQEQRAAVEKRLFVHATPDQPGSWNWFSPTEVHYRSKDYWQPGTRISVRLATGGLDLGGGAYGADDLTIDA